MSRTFYKYVYTVTVLSETPIDDYSLEALAYLIGEGPCVGTVDESGFEELADDDAAALLNEMGSDPSFFDLEVNAEDIDDKEED